MHPLKPSYKDAFCPLKAQQIMKETVDTILLEEQYKNRIDVRHHILEIADSLNKILVGPFKIAKIIEYFLGAKGGSTG